MAETLLALRDLAAFGFVLALAWWASRWLGRQGRVSAPAGLEVLGALSLGAGRQLLAVRAGRRVLILGLADRSVNLLSTMTDPEEIQLLARGGGPAVPETVARLARWLGRHRGEGEGTDA